MDYCVYVGLLFYFVYEIWDYTVLLIICYLFLIGALVLLALSCYLSWRDTHSFRQVFRQNRLWLITLLLLPMLAFLVWCCRGS